MVLIWSELVQPGVRWRLRESRDISECTSVRVPETEKVSDGRSNSGGSLGVCFHGKCRVFYVALDALQVIQIPENFQKTRSTVLVL